MLCSILATEFVFSYNMVGTKSNKKHEKENSLLFTQCGFSSISGAKKQWNLHRDIF